jgi:hypothetical protein
VAAAAPAAAAAAAEEERREVEERRWRRSGAGDAKRSAQSLRCALDVKHPQPIRNDQPLGRVPRGED